MENANPLQIFESTMKLNELVKIICDQSNLYAAQNGREFATTPEKIRAFLGINYIMSISKLPNLKCYWSVDSYLSNDGVRNTMTRNLFVNILQNLHFNDNETADKSDKAYKMRNVINHLNEAFQNAMSDAKRQSIDKHMAKFKVRMSCKQYMKNKPIIWGFKWWCRCCSKTGYLYEFDLYLGNKKKAELGLRETVVLDLSKKLENTSCMLYFDNFFNSPTLVEKILIREYTALAQFQVTEKIWLSKKKDKDMKRGDVDFQYADNVVAVKWFDNRGVTMVGTCLEECYTISTVSRRVKGQNANTPVSCLEIIKDYNSGMSGTDLLDQKQLLTSWTASPLVGVTI